MLKLRCLTLCLLLYVVSTAKMNNGVARTPPMGWNSWNHFGCTIDCKKYPNDCISETLVKQMADAMVTSGMAAAGYQFVSLDDCWLAGSRDSQGRLQPDPTRFPSGIKALSDYVHSKGLKFGIYEDWGTATCEGYPGTIGHEVVDAKTFADWGVDLLKLDGCNADVKAMKAGYTLMSQALNQTGRPIVFSCSWPAYAVGSDPGTPFNYTYIGEICNLWRLYDDINDEFPTVLNIMDYWANQTSQLAPAAGPGKWNDPDMLEVGNGGQSDGEYRIQMSVWAILAAPFIAGNDLRNMSKSTIELLTNREVIEVDQDPAGNQGRRIVNAAGQQVWVRKLADGSLATALVNTGTGKTEMKVTWSQLGITGSWAARDLWDHQNLGSFTGAFTSEVLSHDVTFVKLTRST